MTHCPDCGTTWHSLTECHCATCHQHFGSLDAFDRHRQGPVDTRECVDPASAVLRKDGKPVLRAADRAGRPTWVVDKPGWAYPQGEPDPGLRNEAEGYPSDPVASQDASGWTA